jgi:hypothetical protein
MRFRPIYAPLAVAAAALAMAALASADSPPASVRVKSCEKGSDTSSRGATFVAEMQSVPGAVRMAMRFRLIERSGGPHPKTRVLSLGPWHRSAKNVTRFTFSQTVNGMTPGDSYRVLVQFHWLDGSHNVIEHTKRRSGACAQPGLPDLTVTGIKLSAGQSTGTQTYRVSVANKGSYPAHKIGVALYVNGHLVNTRTIKHLGGGETKAVKMNGPPCMTVEAIVDPDNHIAESNENDNSFSRQC